MKKLKEFNKIIMLVIFFLLLQTSLSAKSQTNKDEINIRITDPSYRLLNIAIPKLETNKGDKKSKSHTAEFREVLYKLVDYTGVFRVINEKAYEGLPILSSEIYSKSDGAKNLDFKPWKSLGIETILRIKIISESNQMRVLVEALDVIQLTNIFRKEYLLINPEGFVEIAKSILDQVQFFYTQKNGIFSSKIVFVGKKTKTSQKQIFTCDVDGRNVRQITYGNSLHLSPSWGPNRNTIIFTSYNRGNPDLYLIDLVSYKVKSISKYQGLNSGGVYSPSGDFIVYTGSNKANTSLYAIDPQSQKRKVITFGKAIYVDPDFSQNGDWLAYVSSEFGNPHIVKAKVTKNKNQFNVKLTDHKRLTYIGWYNTMPRWSPNSEEIIYASYDRSDKRFDLFSMDQDGNNMTRLTLNSGNNEAPTWSPNGRLIMFHSNRNNPNKMNQLYLMNKDGSHQRKINTNLYQAENPRWSF